MGPNPQAIIDLHTFHQLKVADYAARTKIAPGYASLLGIPIHTSPAVPPGRMFVTNAQEAAMEPNSLQDALNQIFGVRARFTPPKTLAQIQEEEQAERERVARQAKQDAFARLDVVNGDEIALVYKEGTSILQGQVTQVRKWTSNADGPRPTLAEPEWQVRIAGFDETPHGSHNTWFPVGRFDEVKVVKRAYRWTERDKAIAASAQIAPETWERKIEADREATRRAYGPRVDRILAALQA